MISLPGFITSPPLPTMTKDSDGGRLHEERWKLLLFSKKCVFLQVCLFFKFPCKIGIFSFFFFAWLTQLYWSFMTVGLYYIQRSRRISFGHWSELPACNLFICLFSWYDFVRNLGGLYGVSVSQALALNFAVFSLFTSLQFLFHTSTLFTGVFYAYLRSSFLTHAQQASLENDQWVTSRKPYFSECTAC